MATYPQIKLFGAPAVLRGPQPITGFISNKASAAIYFVAAIAWSLQAKAQTRQGWFAFHLGRYVESRRLLVESLQRLHQLHAAAETIFNLNYLGALLRHLGEFAQATAYLQAALHLARRYNDAMNTSIALNILGQVAIKPSVVATSDLSTFIQSYLTKAAADMGAAIGLG